MNQPPLSPVPYSLWADFLSKYHLWSEPIQALWLVAGTVVAVGGIASVAWTLREIVALVSWRGAQPLDGLLVSGVYQDRRGRWMVYRIGRETCEVDWTDPPLELVGRGDVRAFSKPER